MMSDHPYRTVSEPETEYDPPPAHVGCVNCGAPRLYWQRFCGAACCAEYEMRRRSTHPQAGEKK